MMRSIIFQVGFLFLESSINQSPIDLLAPGGGDLLDDDDADADDMRNDPDCQIDIGVCL